jgi:hypothetical protein
MAVALAASAVPERTERAGAAPVIRIGIGLALPNGGFIPKPFAHPSGRGTLSKERGGALPRETETEAWREC